MATPLPASRAELGYGSRLQFEMTDGANDFQDIEECGDLPEFGDEHERVPATHQLSPGRRKEYINGLAEGAELNLECNYFRGTVQEAVRRAKGSTRNFRLIYSTTPELRLTFPALIASAKITAPVEEKKKLMIHLQVTGEIAEAA